MKNEKLLKKKKPLKKFLIVLDRDMMEEVEKISEHFRMTEETLCFLLLDRAVYKLKKQGEKVGGYQNLIMYSHNDD